MTDFVDGPASAFQRLIEDAKKEQATALLDAIELCIEKMLTRDSGGVVVQYDGARGDFVVALSKKVPWGAMHYYVKVP